jgi:dual specificity tyrosine-phosphorylation-regulated kinase 1
MIPSIWVRIQRVLLKQYINFPLFPVTVRMKEHFTHKNHLCIVYEILSLNLYEVLRRSNYSGLPLSLVRKFAAQILTTLRFLARPDIQIIHCDLKPEK